MNNAVRVLGTKAYGGVAVQLLLFLISAPDGGEWLASSAGSFTPGSNPLWPLNGRLGGCCGPFREEK